MALSKDDKKGIKYLSFVGIVILTLLVMAIYVKTRNEEYDKATYCRLNHVDDVTFVVVDKTDSWDTTVKDKISNILVKINNSLAPYERLYVYMLETTGIPNRPLFDLCNPMRGNQVSPLYANPRRGQKRDEELFEEPFSALLDEIVSPSVADQTRLLETLMSFKKLVMQDTRPRVIMISDMMENSGMISLYNDFPKYENWVKRPDKAEYQYIGKVEIYYMDRSSISERRKRRAREFWESLFQDANIRNEWLEFDRIMM